MEKGREEDSELRRRRPLSSSSSSSLSSHTPQTPLFKSHAQPTHASSHSANHADHVGSGGDPEDADKVSPDPAPVSSTTPPADQTSSPLPPDERLCRICFGGPEEDDATLGRLISPCKCKGSMKFVHIGCLNEWRRVTQKRESYFECDQCHYRYQFSRTQWANVLRNEVIVTSLTLMAFGLLILIAGFFAKLILIYYFYDKEDFELAAEAAAAANARRTASRVATPDVPWDEAVIDNIFSLLSPERLSLFAIDLTHMVSGIILVGFMGCFSLIYYISLNPFSFGTRLGIHGGGQSSRDSLGAAVLVILIIVGVLKMMYEIYKAVKDWSRRSMEMVESRILDVDEGV